MNAKKPGKALTGVAILLRNTALLSIIVGGCLGAFWQTIALVLDDERASRGRSEGLSHNSVSPRREACADLGKQPPRASYDLAAHDYDQSAATPAAPRMRRWEPLVWQAVDRDPVAFALVMTFIFVESGGRQFAISRSGCVGLMQFCSSTAMRNPFARFFDINRIRSCRCIDRRCAVHWQTRRFLEITDPGLHMLVQNEVPCSLEDPRFVPEQAIAAGWTYIRRLADAFEGSIYLIYVGYNSGPHVAERIWRRVGRSRSRDLNAIGKALRRALRPNFKRWSRKRARSLWRVHLPKVARTYEAYLEVARKRPTAD